MRLLFIATLLATALHLPTAAAEQALSEQDKWEKSALLADLTAHFSGAEELPRIKELLEQGVDPNTEDIRGDTPLLLLCRTLELDYRYRTEPHYSQAVDEAVILLLRNKADALHENRAGCSAMFYLQGKPQLLKRLNGQKLLPPDLAVRIPHDEMALLRYMRRRVAQADLTANEASLKYISTHYCEPGYDRALKLLQKYMRAEMQRDIPSGAMETTLAFIRLAKPAEAESYINTLPIWQHSEHFLEEVPEHFLQSLDALEWNVKPALLQTALDRLDTLLPKNAGEIIDCNAAQPMCCLLTMLDRNSAEPPDKTLERFSRSRDNRLAYTALCLRLARKGLPNADPEVLASVPNTGQGSPPLPAPMQRILECALVDSAIRNTDLAALDAGMVRRVRRAMADMGMPKHAELLKCVVDEKGLAIDEDALILLAEEYTALSEPSPQVIIARYILNHPESFTPAKHESK